MNENIDIIELRTAYARAEREHRAAFRRASWLERRLFAAKDDAEYNDLAAELEQAEERLTELSAALIRARAEYAAAEIMSTKA